MKAAIVIAPYHTNGGYPPLGAACLNAILQEAGCQAQLFDLQFALPTDRPALFFSLRSALNVGKNLHLVQPVLDLRFLLYCLYRHRCPDHDWVVSNDLREEALANSEAGRRRRRSFLELADALDEAADEYAQRIAAGKPEILLFSTYISNLLVTAMLSQRLRTLLPAAAIVYGGPGSALPPVRRLVLRLGLADAVAARDGEPVLRELLARRAASGAIELDLPDLVTLAHQDARIAPHPLRGEAELPSFDGFPMPGTPLTAYQGNWHLEYRSRPFGRFMLPVETCRGCSCRCAFCSESAYWSKFRLRTPDAIVGEIRRQVARYGIRTISFNSSLVNCDDDWHQELLTRLAAETEIEWWGYYRPTADLTAEVARRMYRAGCRMVSLGVESFYQPALDAMHKQTTGREMLEAVVHLADAGILVDFALLSGFPIGGGADSAAAECEANIAYLGELRQRCDGAQQLAICAGHLVRLEPYSALYSRPERYGISIDDDPIDLPAELDTVRELLPELSQRWTSGEPFAIKAQYGRDVARFVSKTFYG